MESLFSSGMQCDKERKQLVLEDQVIKVWNGSKNVDYQTKWTELKWNLILKVDTIQTTTTCPDCEVTFSEQQHHRLQD